MSHHDVIVIGSGIGGLTAALTCARKSRSVLLLEAGKQFGGYLNPFARRHFHFDPGVHYIGEAGPGGPFRHLLDRLGLQDVAFRELDPDGFDRYVFPDFEVANCVGLERFRDRIAEVAPSERDNLKTFFGIIEDLDEVLRRAPRMKSAADAWQVMRRVPSLARWARATLGQMLDHFFDDPRAKAAIAGPCGDLGLPPGRTSALMHLALLAHYSRGAYFPAGGSGPLRDAFVQALEDEGATLRRNASVDRILHEGGSIRGVQLANGEVHRAPAVISNAQATSTYRMAGLENFSERFARKVSDTEQSVASVVVFAGVDGGLDTSHIGSANIWSYDKLDVDAAFSPRALKDYREGGSFFLTVPTNKDPLGGLAPEGMQTVEIVTLCSGEPYQKWFGTRTKRRGEEYEAMKQELAATFFERAEKHLPGLRDHVVLSDVSTPATNLSYAAAEGGNIYGPAHGPDQIGPLRFGVKAPIEGLFLCGASVMSAGVVPCAGSGRDAGKTALRYLDDSSRSWVAKARDIIAPRVVGGQDAKPVPSKAPKLRVAPAE